MELIRNRVDLGFVEEIEPWKLSSYFFPSKIGGKPAWLALENFPSADRLKCGVCGQICVFLMQLYASADNLTQSAFHRTLFVFVCRDPKCWKENCNDNLIVFRSQLSRKNKFYSDAPPNEDNFVVGVSDHPQASDFQTVCVVCGCSGKWKCGKCKEVSYCDKVHQTADWKAGHKQFCGKESTGTTTLYNTGILFKEYGIEIDEDDDDDEEEEHESADAEESEDENMAEYEQIAETVASANETPFSAQELEMAAGKSKEDTTFSEFKRIMEKDPEQVVRYQRGGRPVWVTGSHIPKAEDIPPCEFCHSVRQFEFQVMPTLLRYIEVDRLDASIDWGTLVIYSCSNSCDAGGNYGKEFIWKQDFVN